MNRYIMIHRLRGPAFLLLIGVNALLAESHILGWGKSWPFYLILAGVLSLAERAALAAEENYPAAQYPGQPYPGTGDPSATSIVPAYLGQPTAQALQNQQDSGKNPEGGQL
ncbi:MAG: hypothetical protein ABSE51_12675 [Terracidiphilus sp.]|jgi:hypothetical protein